MRVKLLVSNFGPSKYMSTTWKITWRWLADVFLSKVKFAMHFSSWKELYIAWLLKSILAQSSMRVTCRPADYRPVTKFFTTLFSWIIDHPVSVQTEKELRLISSGGKRSLARATMLSGIQMMLRLHRCHNHCTTYTRLHHNCALDVRQDGSISSPVTLQLAGQVITSLSQG